ncbi:hypothetical protein O181_000196 [Austropuccinia psidii MF-1]|uniref:Uncharacterized protein n=1 Tax=Austropuccinia psidii MF-1 TaxID=1389203 RepID=A0A9Q3GBD5_9BASI|nr:hypothetical protein [Austropuccinia psidii MF-1]
MMGFGFINYCDPSIDWRKGLITFNTDYKDSSDYSIPLSNELFSATPCADLVGNSRIPSFPSSVHIPSLNFPHSLQLSIDEVFKDIKDVQEDNYIYQLHLFHGNVDLPPSSYHHFSEELWDEEEEPEEIATVRKVLASAYHQYLNVFFKVKAEALPPNHA